MELSLINPPRSHHAKKQYYPFVHLDCHLGAGWSTVFVSSKSRLVVKFATMPKKNKTELIRQLSNEKRAYNKLNQISGWIIPRLYGEYEWHGGRALVLSEEGQSLSYLGSSHHYQLSRGMPAIFEEDCADFWYNRLILFAEVYCVHYLGVEHRDLEPRNVLRRNWSCIFKIIDFGFSDVDHICPGWKECRELKEMWSKLQLDRVNFQLLKLKLRLVARLDHLLLFMLLFTWLAFVIMIT